MRGIEYYLKVLLLQPGIILNEGPFFTLYNATSINTVDKIIYFGNIVIKNTCVERV